MFYYQRLRDLREDKDLTQKNIAEFLQIHQVQYHKYESGKRELPFHMAVELAKYYNVSLDYIAGLTNDKRGITRSELPKDETLLLKKYRALPPQNKGRLLERLDMLLGK
ncbi:MAG: helix-turn-helix transcriptional regulator [Ruminiclostridium sp.]|nr:helix-turn-helix transcriptional regulator [Ruminiclostridium sp.]